LIVKTAALVVIESPRTSLHYKCLYINGIRMWIIPSNTSRDSCTEYYHMAEDWRTDCFEGINLSGGF